MPLWLLQKIYEPRSSLLRGFCFLVTQAHLLQLSLVPRFKPFAYYAPLRLGGWRTSERAIQVNIEIMRAFVSLRRLLARTLVCPLICHPDLTLAPIDRKVYNALTREIFRFQ